MKSIEKSTELLELLLERGMTNKQLLRTLMIHWLDTEEEIQWMIDKVKTVDYLTPETLDKIIATMPEIES